MRISVVIPAFDEAGNIGRLVDETFSVLPREVLGEVIVVDDASTDGTAAEIRDLLRKRGRLRLLRHAGRCGQSAAIRTGVLAARYPVIAIMDGDGQNDPADITSLLALIGGGNHAGPAMAGGIRETRRAKGSRRLASSLANWIRDRVLRDGCPDTGCGIKVFHRAAFLHLPYFSSMHRYLPALMQTYGHQVAYAPVNDRARIFGKSKYTNFGRALIGLYDLIGVSWLRRRTVVPRLLSEDAGLSSPARKTGTLVGEH